MPDYQPGEILLCQCVESRAAGVAGFPVYVVQAYACYVDVLDRAGARKVAYRNLRRYRIRRD